MKRRLSPALWFVLLGSLLATAAAGCDDSDKKTELLAKTGGSASATSSAIPIPTIAPAASSAATPAAKAPPKDCPTTPEITIDDPEIDSEVRNKLKKPKETNPTIAVKDLAGVASIRINARKSYTELDPCIFPKLVGLKFLYLPKGTYNDLSPIANLTKMEGLFFPDSEVEDLKPLEKMLLLDQLGMAHTHVRDITVLGNLTNLTELTLDDTAVSDITPIAKLTKMMKLSLKNTQVKDVSALKDLKKLKTLNVAGTAITNLDVLEPLKRAGLKIQTN